MENRGHSTGVPWLGAGFLALAAACTSGTVGPGAGDTATPGDSAKPGDQADACATVTCATNATCIAGTCHCDSGFAGDPMSQCQAIVPCAGGAVGPTIDQVSSSLADGDAVTLSGCQFGIHADVNSIWWLGGKDGWIEAPTTAVGTDPIQAPSTTRIYSGQGVDDEVTDARAWSGAKSINLPNEGAQANSWASTWAYQHPSGFRKIFASFWYYMDVVTFPTYTTEWPQHKFITVTTNGYQGCDTNIDPLRSNNMALYWAYRINDTYGFDMIAAAESDAELGCGGAPCWGNAVYDQATAVGYTRSSDCYWWPRLVRGADGSAATPDPGAVAQQYHFDFNAWNRVDVWMDLGTWDNHDGYIRIKVVKPSGPYVGQQIGVEYDGVLFLSSGAGSGCLRCDAVEKDAFVWYMLFGQTGDPSNTEHVNNFVDDPYIQVGTQARVELGNASVYADCTTLELQKPTSWQGGQIEIELNHGGSFSGNDVAYLFVIDDQGTASPGRQVTLAP